jgi:LysR family transcriptional regulator, regulator for bpeEF and oprC
MDKFSGVTEFVSAVEGKSFVRGAETLGLTPSAVGKAVSRLESRLGVRLFNRTTRSLRLTEDGVTFYARCRQILLDYDEAENVLQGAKTRPSGTLRINVPLSLGHRYIAPALVGFGLRYPELKLEVGVTDRTVDLIEDGIDAVVRIGELPDSSLVSRSIGSVKLLTCASRPYLQRFGTPRRPEELKDHNCLTYLHPSRQRPLDWQFEQGGVKSSVKVTGNISIGSGEALAAAAASGVGICQVLAFEAQDLLATKKLSVILTDYVAQWPVTVLYSQHRQHSQKISVFVRFMVELATSARRKK